MPSPYPHASFLSRKLSITSVAILVVGGILFSALAAAGARLLDLEEQRECSQLTSKGDYKSNNAADAWAGNEKSGSRVSVGGSSV